MYVCSGCMDVWAYGFMYGCMYVCMHVCLNHTYSLVVFQEYCLSTYTTPLVLHMLRCSKEYQGSHSIGLCKGAAGGQWCLCTSPACQGRRDGGRGRQLGRAPLEKIDISGKTQNISK